LTPPPQSKERAIEAATNEATVSIPFTEDDLLADEINLKRSGYVKWRSVIAPLIQRYCNEEK
jgi:hypothetical protein